MEAPCSVDARARAQPCRCCGVVDVRGAERRHAKFRNGVHFNDAALDHDSGRFDAVPLHRRQGKLPEAPVPAVASKRQPGKSHTRLSLPLVRANKVLSRARTVESSSPRSMTGMPEGNYWTTKLYATSDGGRTWRRQAGLKGVDIDLVAVTRKSIDAVAAHCEVRSKGNQGCKDYHLLGSSLRMNQWSSTTIDTGRHPVGACGSGVWMSLVSWSTTEASLRCCGRRMAARR